jgi:ubiquitin conjugation factor E4 B
VLADNSQDELMTFMLVFLSTAYMKNPYLKGQFVEVGIAYAVRYDRASD